MTLSVENLHSTVNKKQTTQTMITYAQSFSIAIKESIKAVTKWGAHYFTSRDTWYPLPDSAIPLSELQFPKKSTTSVVKDPLTSDQKREMREWASSNGAVVRQRSCRQETTMARAGTLPENAYFEELIPQQQDVIENVGTADLADNVDSEIDEVLEYESDSENDVSSDEENVNTNIETITNVTTFLVGHSSRYGRAVKFNKRYVS